MTARETQVRIPDPGPGHTWHAETAKWPLAGGGWTVDIGLRLVDDTEGLHGTLVDTTTITVHVPDEDAAVLLLAQLQGRA